MISFHESLQEYRAQLKKGVIQEAYRGLMEFLMALRTHFNNKYPDYFVSGSLYYGHMDMTYFSFFPKPFQERKLKIAIVFLHETFRFEAWLAGVNKQVQAKYWKLFKECDWHKYRLVSTPKGADSILESLLTDDPDFRDWAALTEQIEKRTLIFIRDVESFLSRH